MALLTVATVGVGQLMTRSSDGLRDRALSNRLDWELVNAREKIGTWELTQITSENIEQLPFSEALAAQVSKLHWEANVTRIAQPAAALQIQLSLHCTIHEQPTRPVSLTFWVEAGEEIVAP